MTINELTTVAHKQARDAGFWDGERNVSECLMLIVSECGEALEAHRSGQQSDLFMFDKRMSDSLPGDINYQSCFEMAFNDCIKDGFSDELADIVIRIADLCGGLGLTLGGSLLDEIPANGNVGEDLLLTTEAIVMFGVDERTKGWYDYKWLEMAIGSVVGIAKVNGIDLQRHIELKLAYNRTRPHKHGKSY